MKWLIWYKVKIISYPFNIWGRNETLFFLTEIQPKRPWLSAWYLALSDVFNCVCACLYIAINMHPSMLSIEPKYRRAFDFSLKSLHWCNIGSYKYSIIHTTRGRINLKWNMNTSVNKRTFWREFYVQATRNIYM